MAKSRKVLVVGLDGATFDLLGPWVEEGRLPVIGEVLKQGTWGRLASVMPPITPAAWASLTTGKNPGQHGVFGFMQREGDSYGTSPIHSGTLSGDRIWHILGRYGLRSIVVNVPGTYPPEKIAGTMMISGMMSPVGEQSITYPPDLLREIIRAVGGYVVYPREIFAPGRAAHYLRALKNAIELRTRVCLYLMERYDWDLFMVVFKETDMAQHAFWGYTDPKHPNYRIEEADEYRDAILQVYRVVDRCIGRMSDRLDGNGTLVIVSDHGMGPLYEFMNVNNWLLQESFLTLKQRTATRVRRFLFKRGLTAKNLYNLTNRVGLLEALHRGMDRGTGYRIARRCLLSFQDVDWSRTQAYSIGFIGQIYLNLFGREPQGIVRPGRQYEDVREHIMGALARLRDPVTGERVVSHIYKKEELYSGERLDQAPDIVFLPKNLECAAVGDVEFASDGILTPAFGMSAHHRRNGILAMTGDSIRKGGEVDGVKIEDLAPTILSLLGVPIPLDMDGRVIPKTLQDSVAGTSTHNLFPEDSRRDEGIYSENEKWQIRARLRALGYL